METINKYEKRVVAFVDILGFANILNKTQTKTKAGKPKDNEPYIQKLYSAFLRIADLMGVEEQPDDAAQSRMVTQFSDSIVISFKVEESADEFRYLLEELLFLHIDLLRQGILIRGGISYGQLVHTEKVLFGPAMVHAYRVESLAANSPRIILPKSLTDLTAEQSEMIKKQTLKLEDLLTLDEDDFYYLDYFDKCQKPELGLFVNDEEYITHLENMKQIIFAGLKTTDPGIYSKYGWMKTKWNKTIVKYNSANGLKLLKAENRKELFKYFKDVKPIKTSM